MSGAPLIQPVLSPALGTIGVPKLHPHPVTPWRAALSGLVDALISTIIEHEDDERQYLTARETAEDIQHAIKTRLQERHGRVFDPLIDGAGREDRASRPAA